MLLRVDPKEDGVLYISEFKRTSGICTLYLTQAIGVNVQFDENIAVVGSTKSN